MSIPQDTSLSDDVVERAARAGFAVNVAETWQPARNDPPTWDTTSEAVRSIWRKIVSAALKEASHG